MTTLALVFASITAQPPVQKLSFSQKVLYTDEYDMPASRIYFHIGNKKVWVKDAFGGVQVNGEKPEGTGYPDHVEAVATYWFAGGGGDLYALTTDKYIVVKERWSQETGGEEGVEPWGKWRTLRLFDRNGKILDKYDPAKITGTYTGSYDGMKETVKITNNSQGLRYTQIGKENTQYFPMHIENAFYGEYWLENPNPNPEVPRSGAGHVVFKKTDKGMTLTLSHDGVSLELVRQ